MGKWEERTFHFTWCFVTAVIKCDEQVNVHPVGTKYEQSIDSTNFKKANKLPKVKNIYTELACRPDCDAMLFRTPFVPTVRRK